MTKQYGPGLTVSINLAIVNPYTITVSRMVSMQARVFMVAVVFLFAGLLAGRLAPLSDLRRVQAELEEVKSAPSRRTASEAAVVGVRSMLKVSDQDLDKAQRIKRARELMSNEVVSAESVTEAGGTGPTIVLGGDTNTPARVRDPASMSNSINQLKKGWEMRTQLARNNLIKRAELDEKAVTQFDVVIEAMNLRLGATVDSWSMKLLEKGSVNEEEGIRLMNELSSVMVLTYDEMNRNLPEGWKEKAGPKFDLMSFIDPEVLTPLQDLEDIEDHTDDDEDFDE